jgi:hypothetical protein
MILERLTWFYDFYSSSIQCKEATYQESIFSYAYSTYNNLFILRIEIKVQELF